MRVLRALTRRALCLSGGSALVTATISAADAQTYADRMGMWHGSWGWGHMLVGGIMMILFWAAVIAMAVLLIRRFSGGSGGGREPSSSGSSARKILEERFARGEIDHQEFEEKKRLLARE